MANPAPIDYSALSVGDTVPVSARRGLTTRKLDKPVWHALRVSAGREIAAVGMLNAADGIDAFVPTEERERTRAGTRITTKHATVTQIVYAKFWNAPQWDVLKERRFITGVFCIGTTPIRLTSDAIRIVRGLPTRAEKMAAAEAELRRVNAGERIRLIEGPFAGMAVDVTKSADGRVWWQGVLSSGLPLSGEVSRDAVEKIQGVDG